MDEVTILIPHFQTLDAIRLCLRALRRYTPPGVRVRVLDNGSRDASRDYLASLRWIELVDSGLANQTWQSHFECLNAEVERVATPLFLVMHSDLHVHDPCWLPFLRAKLASGPYAAVGPRHQSIPVPGLWVLPWRLGAFFERTLQLVDRVDTMARSYFQGLLYLTLIDTACLGVGGALGVIPRTAPAAARAPIIQT